MTLGPVDILVNCAGVMYYTMMKNLRETDTVVVYVYVTVNVLGEGVDRAHGDDPWSC